MGRGRSSGAKRIAKLISLKKQLTGAKSKETKAYNTYMKAAGAVRMTPEGRPKLLAERRETMRQALHKYSDAVNAREKIERKINRLAPKRQGTLF